MVMENLRKKPTSLIKIRRHPYGPRTYLYSFEVTKPCCSELSTEAIGSSKAVRVPDHLTSHFEVHPVASHGQEMDYPSSIRSFQSRFELIAGNSDEESCDY